MEFNEKLAAKIIKEYNLSQNTLRTWKRRGIPEKYLKNEALNKVSGEDVDRLLDILKDGKINKKELAKETGVRLSRMQDFTKGKASLSETDFNRLKSKINELKLYIIRSLGKYSVIKTKLLLKNEIIYYNKVLASLERSERDQVSRLRNGRVGELERFTYEKVKNKYTDFAKSLNFRTK